MQLVLPTTMVALAALIGTVMGEVHTVSFTNLCPRGSGTPILVQGPTILSTGADYTVSGTLDSTIAYFQTRNCGFNGENCTLIELALDNAAGSQVDINISPPHKFNVAASFEYYNGCDGTGAFCANASSCDTTPVACLEDDVNLDITFSCF